MSGTPSRLPSRAIVAGLFAAILIGLLGSWAGQAIGAAIAAGTIHDYVVASAAIVVGALGGAAARHLTGLLATWLGVVLALLLGVGLAAPGFGLVSSPVALLLFSGAGYAIGRMIDPVWGGRPN
jgi:hypothetical protein